MWKLVSSMGLPEPGAWPVKEDVVGEGESSEEDEDDDRLLPPELWLAVFDFLEGKDLTACQLVCREWYALASHDHRAEEYVARWREEKAKKEAERIEQRERKRQQRRNDCCSCCSALGCGCFYCMCFAALCPCCCPCITCLMLSFCCRSCHELCCTDKITLANNVASEDSTDTDLNPQDATTQ